MAGILIARGREGKPVGLRSANTETTLDPRKPMKRKMHYSSQKKRMHQHMPPDHEHEDEDDDENDADDDGSKTV